MKTSKLTFSALLLLASVPLALAQGTYTQIDYPGAQGTLALGIDGAGDVVGTYIDSSNNHHGFLLSGGVYTTIDDPGVPNGSAFGINDFGQIVGNNGYLSYLYSLQTQTFTAISFPNAQATTSASAINNAGTIVGSLSVSGRCCIGFELENGSYRSVVRQGSNYTILNGINNLGAAVGFDLLGLTPYNFLYVQGKFQVLRIPSGTRVTNAVGVNDSATIVGSYQPAPHNQGFVYQNGVFQEIAFPGSVSGEAFGINNSGEVVGMFVGSDQNFHGFTWTPPADVVKK